MQITIIGKFDLDSKSSGTGFGSAGVGDNMVLCDDLRQAIEKFDAGMETDLIICAPEIEMGLLVANFELLGISVPAMLQPAKREDSANTKDHDVAPQQHDVSGWIGDEKNPLRLGQRLADMEREAILQTLTHCGGNRTYAAEILGISARTMRNKLQQYAAEGCTIISPRYRQSAHEQALHPLAILDA